MARRKNRHERIPPRTSLTIDVRQEFLVVSSPDEPDLFTVTVQSDIPPNGHEVTQRDRYIALRMAEVALETGRKLMADNHKRPKRTRGRLGKVVVKNDAPRRHEEHEGRAHA